MRSIRNTPRDIPGRPGPAVLPPCDPGEARAAADRYLAARQGLCDFLDACPAGRLGDRLDRRPAFRARFRAVAGEYLEAAAELEALLHRGGYDAVRLASGPMITFPRSGRGWVAGVSRCLDLDKMPNFHLN